MLTWIRRLLARWLSLPVPPPRLRDALERLDLVEERVDYQGGEIKRLRGRLTGAIRHEKADEPPKSQDSLEGVKSLTSMQRRAMIIRRATEQRNAQGPRSARQDHDEPDAEARQVQG